GLTARCAHAIARRSEALLGKRNERKARFGERDRTRCTLEQRDAHLVLELLDPLAERGGCERDAFRRCAKIQEPRCRGEASQTVDRGKHAPQDKSWATRRCKAQAQPQAQRASASASASGTRNAQAQRASARASATRKRNAERGTRTQYEGATGTRNTKAL